MKVINRRAIIIFVMVIFGSILSDLAIRVWENKLSKYDYLFPVLRGLQILELFQLIPSLF